MVKLVNLIAVVHNCAQVTDPVYLFECMTKWLASMKKTDPYRRKNLADIFYTSRDIVNFVSNFVAMATGVNRVKMQLAAFDGPSRTLPPIGLGAKILQKSPAQAEL